MGVIIHHFCYILLSGGESHSPIYTREEEQCASLWLTLRCSSTNILQHFLSLCLWHPLCQLRTLLHPESPYIQSVQRTVYFEAISAECITSHIPFRLEPESWKNGPFCFPVPDPDHFSPFLLQKSLFFQGSQYLAMPLSPRYYCILNSSQLSDSFSFIRNI